MRTWLTLKMWLSPGGMTLGEGPVVGQGQTVSICPGSCWARIFYARFEHWGQQGLCHLLASRDGVEVNVRPEAIDLYPEDPALTSVFVFRLFHFFIYFLKKSVYPPPSGFPGGSEVKNPLAMQETWVWPLGWEDPLEKGTTTHSSILAWRILWTGA